ncbi:MAG: hypothetical protein A3G24_01450 [Betaproteobacteria bacterium RIFCSPLOWO2_12_FULL_62_13]|nr:MAG: hypothetical protein A3G24_01450 [Betaproteobacteria bacterium RIFCSPLOWO2_12_FULL_62_13]
MTGLSTDRLGQGAEAGARSGAPAKSTLSGLRLGGQAQRYLFRVSTPIGDPAGGDLLGWLDREYDVKNLLDPLIYPIRFGATGHVMLIDNRGAIVSCPLLATGSRISDWRELEGVVHGEPGWSTAYNDGHGGRKFSIIGHAPLRTVNDVLETGVSWHMFVWQDSREIFAPARSLLAGMTLAGLFALSLLAILGYYASRRIVEPIRRLGEEAAHIAGGDLNRPLDIRTHDEIEDLAEKFDDMRVQLRKLIGHLEEQVEQRTRALQDTQAEKDRVVESLIQAEKMAAIGTLASGIGHEINNPLYAILGKAEAIRDETDPARRRQYSDDIIRRSKQIATIVEDLSGYVRPGSQRDWVLVNVNHQLSEAIALARHSLLSDHVEFRKRLGAVGGVAAKPDEIRQAFFNVIRNAIQAMQGRGILEVASDMDEGGIRVSIRDAGPGIPKEQQRKIFDPFFTTKGPDEGEGLGLYIVQQIVKKYGGSVAVQSEEGQGTTFTFRFPASQPLPDR